jgi:ribonuclease VapC
MRVEQVPVSPEHAELARAAYRRFGKGRHPARLNFGDCFAYALAQATGDSLLFVGDDFSRTDIPAA